MLKIRTILGAWLGLAAMVGSLALPAAPALAQATRGHVARPDLALGLEDLPAGYEEVASLGLTIGDTALEDRALRRLGAGVGPWLVWSGTFHSANPVTVERIARWHDQVATVWGRAYGADVVFKDWAELDPVDVGDHAIMYEFRYEVADTDIRGEGALVVFSRGDLVTFLGTLQSDARTTVDLRQYARLLDARVQRESTLASQ
jgi:hypothetical protein